MKTTPRRRVIVSHGDILGRFEIRSREIVLRSVLPSTGMVIDISGKTEDLSQTLSSGEIPGG